MGSEEFDPGCFLEAVEPEVFFAVGAGEEVQDYFVVFVDPRQDFLDGGVFA